MEIKINGAYRLNQDIKIPSSYNYAYFGLKGQCIKIVSVDRGVCLVLGEGLKYFVKSSQLSPILTKEETMIECTLQEAVKRCRENGGRFISDGFPWHVRLPNGYIVSEEAGERMQMKDEYFDATWIYEAPKQSAFQKWEIIQNQGHPFGAMKSHLCRKEGWNAAIDKTLRILIEDDVDKILEKVTKLKEP